MQYKLLIIEDNTIHRETLSLLLQSQGYIVTAIENFSHIVAQIETQKPHLLLLDINLPSEDGFTLCAKIRTFSNAPIIFITGRAGEVDELHSIMLGGDAFITKPYSVPILLAKIASLLKRAYPQSSPLLSYEGLTLHLETSKLSYQGKQLDLTKNELKILYYFLTHPEIICSRIDIIEYLWDNQIYVDDNTLSVNITRLREKLSQVGLSHYLQTKYRQGYILCK